MDVGVGVDVEMDLDFNTSRGNVGTFGTPLVEVFNARIPKNDEVHCRFWVEDRKGALYFCNTSSTGSGSVKPEGTLLSLTAPPRIISASGRITFFLDLKDKNGKELINSSFCLNLMDESTIDIFDRYLTARISGTLGCAEIYYTIPMIALGATIEFKLLKINNGCGDHLDVSGTIVAHYGNDYDNSVSEEVKQYSRFMLYEKTPEDKPFQLKDKDILPLSRSLIIVPARVSTVIKMDLEFLHPDGQSEQIKTEIEVSDGEYSTYRPEFKLNRWVLKARIFFNDEFGLLK